MTGKPASACKFAVISFGLLAFAVSTGFMVFLKPFSDILHSALAIIAATAIAIALADLLIGKVHENPSAGLDFSRSQANWRRVLVKYLGLWGSLGAVAFCYWLFPEYHGSFFSRYYSLLSITLPPILVLAVPYFYWLDSHQRQPQDGYWQMGNLILARWHELDFPALRQHLLGWAVKAFFLPLMFTYFCNDLERLQTYSLTETDRFKTWFDLFYDLVFYVDVVFATIGYIFSLRIIDTHIRSVEPTLLGWAVALACYEPFWSLIGRNYLAYQTDYAWGAWLGDHPFWYAVWGTLILLCLLVYTWSTLMFGLRFSNLTHRGIITSGPYAWFKHPAYVSKNLSWWLVSVPFVVQGTVGEAMRHGFLLLCLNGLYWLRAITEERHLSRDPVYVEYAAWIARHGVLSRLAGLLPFRPGIKAY